eukprot:m.360927 g.360927  ORF g.360927 m.360927 type:complete len:408 (-) comp19233_c0_seq1:289-1512(-)
MAVFLSFPRLALLTAVAVLCAHAAVPGDLFYSVLSNPKGHIHGTVLVNTEGPDTFAYFATLEPSNTVFKVNATDGRMQWRASLGTDRNGVRNRIAYHNGLVHFGTDDSTAMALEASTGKTAWKYKDSNQSQCWDNDHFRPCEMYATAIIVDDRVIHGSEDNITRCFNVSSGALLWQKRFEGQSNGSPIQDPLSGDILFGVDDGFFYRMDPSTSAVRFKFRHCGAVHSIPSLGPNRLVYFTCFREDLLHRDTHPSGVVYAIHADTGKEVWSIDGAGGVPLYVKEKDRVFVSGFDGSVACVDPASGQVYWNNTMSFARKEFMGPLVYDATHDLLYGGNIMGYVYAIDAAKPNGVVVWKTQASTRALAQPLGLTIWNDTYLFVGTYSGELSVLHLTATPDNAEPRRIILE